MRQKTIARKLVTDWFVMIQMLVKLDNTFHANDYVIYSFVMKILITSYLLLAKCILAADLNKIKVDSYNIFDEIYPESNVRLLSWHPKRW